MNILTRTYLNVTVGSTTYTIVDVDFYDQVVDSSYGYRWSKNNSYRDWFRLYVQPLPYKKLTHEVNFSDLEITNASLARVSIALLKEFIKNECIFKLRSSNATNDKWLLLGLVAIPNSKFSELIEYRSNNLSDVLTKIMHHRKSHTRILFEPAFGETCVIQTTDDELIKLVLTYG